MKIYLVFLFALWGLLASAFAQAQETQVQGMIPGKTFRDCDNCPEMVIIPPGAFEMGSHNNVMEKPLHIVVIRKAFAMGKTEVTQGQWKAVMGYNPSYFYSCGDDCPVDGVSWIEAQEFIRLLNKKTGKSYSLPSEAEWEYACHAGEQQEYCGSDNIDSVAWYNANSFFKTHPVAQKQPNAFGLYDMSGNVIEWILDTAEHTYTGAPKDGRAWFHDPPGRDLRGGSWANGPDDERATKRTGAPNFHQDSPRVGFRIVRELP